MSLNESETLKSSRIVQFRKQNNLPVYNAGLGANPFPPHQKLKDFFQNNIQYKNYTSPAGLDSLKKTLISPLISKYIIFLSLVVPTIPFLYNLLTHVKSICFSINFILFWICNLFIYNIMILKN